MSHDQEGALTAGWKLLWHRQRLLWWAYGVNLLLGVAGTVALRARAGAVLDRSFAAEPLVHGFDLPTFVGLANTPSRPLGAAVPGSILSTLIFFIWMLFLMGGILEAYRRDRTLATGEFFEACGRFFWRLVRLLILLLIALVPVFVLVHFVLNWSDRLSTEALRPRLGFWVEVVGLLVLLFLSMAVRLWFDMAQVRAVAEDERAIRRSLLRAFKLSLGNFGPLFWIYLRLSLLAWFGLAAALWVWVKFVRPEWLFVSFLLGQAIVFLWLATRLWLRASETVWYQRSCPAPIPDAPDANLPPLEPS
jgi:hypothetical protein